MASWHDAQRMQLELVHLQHSLLDDPPVLIRATNLPGVGLTAPASTTPSATAGRRQAVQIGADDQAPAVRGSSGGRVGPVLTNTNGGGRTSYPGRAPASSQEQDR